MNTYVTTHQPMRICYNPIGDSLWLTVYGSDNEGTVGVCFPNVKKPELAQILIEMGQAIREQPEEPHSFRISDYVKTEELDHD
jgi:hypothetical protein